MCEGGGVYVWFVCLCVSCRFYINSWTLLFVSAWCKGDGGGGELQIDDARGVCMKASKM